ncbi:FecR protein [Novipirellula galeiformis]|uniref:FecR protein n=1 Tax=Novipirellula galeiformis TaxID=2528004 RepID=A0A5C6BZD8_9BACT|nr:LamG-like jellyroll fold domain-containing protein [Novipirellula galeiformis]TWU17222.1 FecR protein [Novipirellula galeiformis]
MSELRFDEQLGRLLDGEIEERELSQLTKSLASDEELCKRFRDHLQIDEALTILSAEDRSAVRFVQLLDLRLEAESQKFDFLNSVLDRSSVRAARDLMRRWAPLATAVLAATVLAAFAAGLWTGRQVGPRAVKVSVAEMVENTIPAEPVDDSVAILKQVVDARWAGDVAFAEGDAVSPHEVIHLQSGLVQLQFFRGAMLTLEGPARLEIKDQDQVQLYAGRAWAQVPVPARGFTVLTPETKIVDLGTEFGVSAMPGERTEVRVFDGLVELYDPAASSDATLLHELATGQSLSVDSRGRSAPLAERVTEMPPQSLLQRKRQQQIEKGYQRWRQWSEEIRLDPRVLLYYTFDPPVGSPTTLRNQASAERLSDGAVIGCSWSEGRWPQKTALDFKRPSDRVRFHLAGEFESVTLAAWVRVDGLDRMLSSLLLTDGWDAGEIHWQFDREGQLGLSVGHASGVKWRYTDPLVDLTRLGSWVHVASVFDGPNKSVRHYFNGSRVPHEELLEYDGLVRIGDAELCNWGRPLDQTSKAIRNFNGRMDEFLLLSDALEDAEIQRIYESGNPN